MLSKEGLKEILNKPAPELNFQGSTHRRIVAGIELINGVSYIQVDNFIPRNSIVALNMSRYIKYHILDNGKYVRGGGKLHRINRVVGNYLTDFDVKRLKKGRSLVILATIE